MIARRTLRIQRPLFAFIRKVGTSLAVRLPQSNMLCVRNYIPPPTYIQETVGSLQFFEAGLPQIKRGVSRKPGAVLKSIPRRRRTTIRSGFIHSSSVSNRVQDNSLILYFVEKPFQVSVQG